jgi:hypothetical protein
MDKYKYCQDFCPLYQAIEDFNKGRGIFFSCTQAKIDCGYIEKIVRQRRGESEEADERENH